MPDVVLYDIPSKGRCASWALNPTKTRLILNYKGIDYKTEWLEFPDIAPTLKSLGLPSNKEGLPYTTPAIRLPDGTYAMDSWAIAAALEKAYPFPSLHLDYKKLPEVLKNMQYITHTTIACWLPKIPQNLLSPLSAEYFNRTKQEHYEMPLEQLAIEQGKEERWEEAKVAVNTLDEILRESGGPFYMGETVSYADFLTIAFFNTLRRIDEADFQKALRLSPSLEILYHACEGWLKRSEY